MKTAVDRIEVGILASGELPSAGGQRSFWVGRARGRFAGAFGRARNLWRSGAGRGSTRSDGSDEEEHRAEVREQDDADRPARRDEAMNEKLLQLSNELLQDVPAWANVP